MRTIVCTALMLFLLPLASAAETQRLYRWVDSEGNVHFGDSVPAEYAEMDKQILNEHGVTVDRLRGKKSAEELAEEQRLAELEMERELRRRADAALLATYMDIDEILMHRDRRVELFQAQTRVTELYLRNLQKRLNSLTDEASKFQPYNDDPDAPMIASDLSQDIATTKDTIARHQSNLQRFQHDEKEIIERFETDIQRFRHLKGSDKQTAAATSNPSSS